MSALSSIVRQWNRALVLHMEIAIDFISVYNESKNRPLKKAKQHGSVFP